MRSIIQLAAFVLLIGSIQATPPRWSGAEPAGETGPELVVNHAVVLPTMKPPTAFSESGGLIGPQDVEKLTMDREMPHDG